MQKGVALNGARDAQPRGRSSLLEASAARSGNLPGHYRVAFACREPGDPRKMAAKQRVCDMRLFTLSVLTACLSLAPPYVNAEDGGEKAQGVSIAVIDLDYVDTSGEERDQRREHEIRLNAFMRALKDGLGKGGKFQLVTPICQSDPCSLAGSTVSAILAAAREAGAGILLIGGIHKMSTLVQWAKIEAIDVRTGRIAFDKLFTFRGDTDEAWRRAEAFISDEITALPIP